MPHDNGISRHGKGAHAPSVEGMLHGNNFMICRSILFKGILTSHLNGPFNSFRTAVGKENPFKATGFNQLMRRIGHRLRIIKIGNMH